MLKELKAKKFIYLVGEVEPVLKYDFTLRQAKCERRNVLISLLIPFMLSLSKHRTAFKIGLASPFQS